MLGSIVICAVNPASPCYRTDETELSCGEAAALISYYYHKYRKNLKS